MIALTLAIALTVFAGALAMTSAYAEIHPEPEPELLLVTVEKDILNRNDTVLVTVSGVENYLTLDLTISEPIQGYLVNTGMATAYGYSQVTIVLRDVVSGTFTFTVSEDGVIIGETTYDYIKEEPTPDPEPSIDWEFEYNKMVTILNTTADKLGESEMNLDQSQKSLTEQIQQNQDLKEQMNNFNTTELESLQLENQTLKDKIDNLNQLVLEQVKVIYKWVLNK